MHFSETINHYEKIQHIVSKVELNLNDRVKAKVTSVGKEIYKKYYTDLGMDPNAYPIEEDVEGWSEWSLWELMHLFGDAMYNGCRVPVETTVIIKSDNWIFE